MWLWTFIEQESPPAWTQEAYRPPCSRSNFLRPGTPPPPENLRPGTPPPPEMLTDRHLWKQYLPVILRMRAVIKLRKSDVKYEKHDRGGKDIYTASLRIHVLESFSKFRKCMTHLSDEVSLICLHESKKQQLAIFQILEVNALSLLLFKNI